MNYIGKLDIKSIMNHVFKYFLIMRKRSYTKFPFLS